MLTPKLLLLFALLPATSQSQTIPTTYTITEIQSLFFPDINLTYYRDASRAAIDQSYPPRDGKPRGYHIRTLFDLNAHTQYTWDLIDTSGGCGVATFSGDWGDPFVMSASMMTPDPKQTIKRSGPITVNGFVTNVIEATSPDGVIKIWQDPKTGLIIKATTTPTGHPATTFIEVKQLSLAALPASTFAMPAICAAAAAAPRPPTEQQRIAAETGDTATNYSNAIMPPASKDSCSAFIRMMRAPSTPNGDMQPILTDFQIAIDPHVDQQHSAQYITGVRQDGTVSYSGGDIHELTAQLHNGVLRVDNVPEYFQIATHFRNGGDASALIYRHCAGPQTVLLYIVKDPSDLSTGADWLWATAGKFATSPH
jgi:hypothetical protein